MSRAASFCPTVRSINTLSTQLNISRTPHCFPLLTNILEWLCWKRTLYNSLNIKDAPVLLACKISALVNLLSSFAIVICSRSRSKHSVVELNTLFSTWTLTHTEHQSNSTSSFARYITLSTTFLRGQDTTEPTPQTKWIYPLFFFPLL